MIPKSFKKIKLNHFNTNDDISENINSLYFCKIYNYWYSGKFSKKWYGLNFDNWGTSGIQLSSINSVYRIVFKQKK
jgi:hypothetical protein